MARSNLQIATGTYAGDGTDNRNITGVGFRPQLLIVKGGSNDSVWRTRLMRGDASMSLGSLALAADQVQELLADGFQVGTSALVNAAATTYYYIAMRGTSVQNYFRTGNYRGTGADNRDYTTGGLGFTPDMVVVGGDTAQSKAWRSSAMVGDLTEFFAGIAGAANCIQNLQSGGFQLGTDSRVNSNTLEYYWAAWKALSGVMAVGTYTGTGVSQSITGLGFAPSAVILKRDTGSQARLKTTDVSGISSLFMGAAGSTTDGITALGSDGFTVSTDASVNGNGLTYYWAAFRAGSFNAPITRTAV